MGTKQHKPPHDKAWASGHPHDSLTEALGPGVRPNTKSRILEARKRHRTGS